MSFVEQIDSGQGVKLTINTSLLFQEKLFSSGVTMACSFSFPSSLSTTEATMRILLLFCLAVWHFLPNAYSLSPGQRPVKRVAVVGAGISGLSVAHCLTNSPSLKEKYGCSADFDVSIFDSRPTLDMRAGAGVQLNGGLAVLGWINPDVQKAVIEAGLPQEKVQSRAKAWNENDPFDVLFERNLPETVMKKGGDVAKNLIDKDNNLLWISIMRGALQESLIETLPEETKNDISFGKQMVGIRSNGDVEGGSLLEFSDGSVSGPFDLIVGCDGIKSACKEYIDTGTISADPSQREGSSKAIYSGIRIKYAVRDGKESDEGQKTSGLTQFFGDGAYALDGTYGSGAGKPNSKSAFLIYLDDDYIGPFRRKDSRKTYEVSENADWTQDVEVTLESERKAMKAALDEAGINPIDVGPTIDAADRIFSLGVYYHNPLTLFGWSRRAPNTEGAQVVLVGDAAHGKSSTPIHFCSSKWAEY